MSKLKSGIFACALLVSGVALAQVQNMPGGPAVNQLNLPVGVTQISRDIVWLHWLMLGICLAIFVAVFGVMFYSIWAHRKSKGHKAATFHEHVGIEIAWTIIPFFIVIGMALPATRTVVAMKDTSGSDMTIKVTAYQWKWGYEYVDGPAKGLSFLSNLSTPLAQIENREPKGPFYLMEVDNPLVVPVGKKVRLQITAGDVIHSWAVQSLGVKQDAIPGFLRDAWFRAEVPGTYRGQCSELCGKEHAFMPIVVQVLPAAEYAAWVDGQQQILAKGKEDPNKQWTSAELVTKGTNLYGSMCISCHQANGAGITGAFPALDGSKIVTGPKADNVAILLKGKPGTAMQSFAQLSDTDLASLITYSRQSWGNGGNGQDPVVMPADIQAAR
jgi:cytochrome c oxidase subunit 2